MDKNSLLKTTIRTMGVCKKQYGITCCGGTRNEVWTEDWRDCAGCEAEVCVERLIKFC